MSSFKCLVAVAALCSSGFLSFHAPGEESAENLVTPLSSTAISGYLNSATRWRQAPSGSDAAVGVAAIRPLAWEGKFISRSPRTGAFKFFRSGDIAKPLTVYFQVGGTAVAGVDYVASSNGRPFPIYPAVQPDASFSPDWSSSGAVTVIVIGGPPVIIVGPVATVRLPDSIVIPAWRRTVTLTIDPLNDRLREMAESIVVSLVSNHEGFPSSAAVQIIDND